MPVSQTATVRVIFFAFVLYCMSLFSASSATAADDGYVFTLWVNGEEFHGWKAGLIATSTAIVGLYIGGAALTAVGAAFVVVGAGTSAIGASLIAAPIMVLYTGVSALNYVASTAYSLARSGFGYPQAHAMPMPLTAYDFDYLFLLPVTSQSVDIKKLLNSKHIKSPVEQNRIATNLMMVAGISNMLSLSERYQQEQLSLLDKKQSSAVVVIDRAYQVRDYAGIGELAENEIEKILEHRTFNYDQSSLSSYPYKNNFNEVITDRINEISKNMDAGLAGSVIYITMTEHSAWVAVVPYF